ncbi:hypothetical protein J0895_07985 [Phormidium pseudopriestleyi FRX01]|uniref:Uncharacterized protein n=1 Tax=Phormidium pseudopriestleyi FRX01 TaxID=1759528 RepID=A0ABS3FPP2_9CYAN|nr:hypothetical protein [Phormidium pseudopriestleyi]MBO0349040.1 hypothetical protein [Phormidium pseudopriestleyi FRX01]
MKPKFKDTLAWQQAEILMQPALIRVLDNIRKQLEDSSWEGTYEDVQTPLPGYLLCLKRGEAEQKFNVWELCFEICFQNYSPTHAAPESRDVEVDSSLIDEEGEVDWNRLDEKAKQLVEEIFANLPNL